MIVEDKRLIEDLFYSFDLIKYAADKNIASLVGLSLSNHEDIKKKVSRDIDYSVDENLNEPYTPELDDLARLHWLVTTRKATTILEFGVGFSTLVFNKALVENQSLYPDENRLQLRRNNLHECHTVDNQIRWIREVQSKHELPQVIYHEAKLLHGQFNERICTYYDPLPNVCPDFIYLDGPDQFSAEGCVRGISTRHKDRMPMAADILSIEHFLVPGTLIVVDGRTANARFIKCNLQRDWFYYHDQEADQHYFELVEDPLGEINRRQLNYCLEKQFFDRLEEMHIAKHPRLA